MFWILVFSYWIHLISTVVWFGALLVVVLAAWPAFRRETLAGNDWLAAQKKLLPWANLSLVLLLITGFVQMTNDPNYNGFLAIDGIWAWAMLVKHIAFILLIGVVAYMQFGLFPAFDRLAMLQEQRPSLAQAEQEKLIRQEKRLLWVNIMCAAVILFCTAVATAV